MINEDLLLKVHKPAQYIGREWNSSQTDFPGSELSFALCFPDLYEVGMSNLGIRIIHGLLNSITGICCERCFAPGEDMEKELRQAGRKLVTLESGSALCEFDIVGFSLPFELCYTNVLNMLEMGGIPLASGERGKDDPLVIGGGPCVMNPEPVHEFFDLFLFGEAEEALPELLELYRRNKKDLKSGRILRRELLEQMSAIEGIYVPSLYKVEYDQHGAVSSIVPEGKVPATVKKRFLKDLDHAFYPAKWVTPYVQIIHDRITMEIMRGCPNRCRFCQARQQYYPFRVKSAQRVMELCTQAYLSSGYEEISLAGLSVSDYRGIDLLVKGLIQKFRDNAVGVSLPSIKPKDIVGDLSGTIASVRKSGFTFAPEAGSERIRRILGKDFPQEEFLEGLRKLYVSGYQHVKLYFMIGIAGESREDLDEILNLSRKVSELRKTVARGPAEVNVSVNTLIPKPHTPLQWMAMEDIEAVRSKQNYIRGNNNSRRIKLNFHNPQMSFLESVLARGDRRLSKVILSAYRSGGRFDSWNNSFLLERWTQAFSEQNIDPMVYLRQKQLDEVLPWDMLDPGCQKDSLKAEYSLSLQET